MKHAQPEDPLMKRTRIETANQLGNAIVDVVNEFARTHGTNDPNLNVILCTALSQVAAQIADEVDPEFQKLLADTCLSFYRERE